MTDPTSPDYVHPSGRFTLKYQRAADGAIWQVLSPEGVSVWRTDSISEAAREAIRRSGGDEDVIEEGNTYDALSAIVDQQVAVTPATEEHLAEQPLVLTVDDVHTVEPPC